jgi:hypothetical protein
MDAMLTPLADTPLALLPQTFNKRKADCKFLLAVRICEPFPSDSSFAFKKSPQDRPFDKAEPAAKFSTMGYLPWTLAVGFHAQPAPRPAR